MLFARRILLRSALGAGALILSPVPAEADGFSLKISDHGFQISVGDRDGHRRHNAHVPHRSHHANKHHAHNDYRRDHRARDRYGYKQHRRDHYVDERHDYKRSHLVRKADRALAHGRVHRAQRLFNKAVRVERKRQTRHAYGGRNYYGDRHHNHHDGCGH